MRHRERGPRNSQPGQDVSDPDQVLEALLAGCPLPDEDRAGLQPLADVLAALRQPATAAELTGQASVLAAFRARPHRAGRTAWSRRRSRPARGPGRLRPRPVTALAAGAVVVAGLAAGAYEGDLPAPMQQWAHHTFGLTAARSKVSHRPAQPRHSTSPAATPSPTHRAGQPDQPKHAQQYVDGHHASDWDKHGQDGWRGSSDPTPSSDPSSSSSSSAPATPEPSTSPAAQPSAQSSTAPGPHQSDSAPSSPP